MGAAHNRYPKQISGIPADLCVTIPRRVGRDDLAQMDAWLQRESGAIGEYWRSTAHWHQGAEATLFVFTDSTTACAFKIRFV